MQPDRPNSHGDAAADSSRNELPAPALAYDNPHPDSSAHYVRGHLGIVVVSLLLLSAIPLGFIAWHQFKSSDRSIAVQVETVRSLGRQRTMQQCVDEVLRSRAACDGMRPLCDGAVGEMMDACIAAADRTQECTALGDRTMSTRFGFDDCHSRTQSRAARSACAGAYRAIAAACQELRRTR